MSDGNFYTHIKTRLIKKILTDSSGQFTVHLVPGKYSVFVKEGNGLYANKLDGQGNINPVEVTRGSKTDLLIRIDYKAVY